MKILKTLAIASLLIACSPKAGNLTLSCHGAVIKMAAKQEIVTTQVTRTYKLQDYKIDDYDCNQQSNIISCNFIQESEGVRQRKRIIYNVNTHSFVEIDATWAIGEKINTNERSIARLEFIGQCQKPILN